MKHTVFLTVLILSAMTILVYANSIHNEFAYDDEQLIVNNDRIRSTANISIFFTKPLFKTGNFYRPIQTISNAIDYKLWKLNPFGYHRTNVLLHLCNAILIFYAVILLSNRAGVAFLTGLLFTVHPIHTEAVTYISGRADPLAALFCLLSFILFIKHADCRHSLKRGLLFVGSIISYLSAVLSKEIAVIFPLIFVLYEVCFVKKKRESFIKTISNLRYISFVIVLIIYAIVRTHILTLNFPKSSMYSIVADSTLFQRFLTSSYVTVSYIRLLFLPFNLHMDRMIKPIISISDPRFLFSSLILVTIFGFIIKNRKNNKLLFFSALWFFINLLPVSNIIPLNAFIAEHWLYLPSVGFFVILSMGLIKLTCIKSLKYVTILLSISIIGFYSFLTIRQNRIWKDPLTFYQYTLRFSPDRPRIRNNLGNAYSNKGLYKKAIKEYKEATRLNPKYAEPHTGLGNVYLKIERYDDAILEYKIAISLNQTLVSAYNNLAGAYSKKGRYADAIIVCNQALKLAPDDYEIWFNLAEAYRLNEDFANAIEAYRQVIKYNPELFNAYLNLGAIFIMNNKNEEAITEYKIALKLKPDSAEAYFNLGIAYAKLERFGLAKEFFNKAFEINSSLDKAKNNLDALRQMGY